MVIHDTEVRYRTFLVVDNVGSNGSTNKSTGRTMPPYRYSARYGHKLMPSATITHQLPGVWRIIYHTNEHGFRTGMPPISNLYDRPNIVVIGDANTFGLGVADGEEFSALLNNALGTEASVVNLGVPGWGLKSEIRVYYEFGRLFSTRGLSFCSLVTTILTTICISA